MLVRTSPIHRRRMRPVVGETTALLTLALLAVWCLALRPRSPGGRAGDTAIRLDEPRRRRGRQSGNSPQFLDPRAEQAAPAAASADDVHPGAASAKVRRSISIPRRSGLRRAVSGVMTLLTLALLGFWFVALRPLSLGGAADYTVIHGNSMWPLYRDGDLIITHQQSTYTAGEIVAYHVPEGEIGQGDLVIHRIVGGSTSTGLQLKGDNNPNVDPWHPRLADVAGSTWLQIPRAGRVLVLLRQPLALAVVAALLTVVVVLRSKPRRPDADAARPVVALPGPL
jgi:signal peptidase I